MQTQPVKGRTHRWAHHERWFRTVLYGPSDTPDARRAAEAIAPLILREARAVAIRSRCHQPEDVAHEAVARWLSAIPDMRRTHAEGSPVFPFACAALRNITRAVIRSGPESARPSASLSDLLPDRHPGPIELLERRETGDRVRAAIKRLPQRSQRVVRLRLEDGLPADEAGHLLGVAASTVNVLLHRAVLLLRTDLAATDVAKLNQARRRRRQRRQ